MGLETDQNLAEIEISADIVLPIQKKYFLSYVQSYIMEKELISLDNLHIE